MQISLTPFCGHERDSTKMHFCKSHIVLDQTVSAFSGKYFLLSFKHFCSKCTKNPALTTTPTTPWHLLEPKLELLIYSVFPPILFCARPWSELKSWCTFQKQLSLCSTVGLVVLAVSPTQALSTSIFSRLLAEQEIRWEKVQFQNVFGASRWLQFIVEMPNSTRPLFAGNILLPLPRPLLNHQ